MIKVQLTKKGILKGIKWKISLQIIIKATIIIWNFVQIRPFSVNDVVAISQFCRKSLIFYRILVKIAMVSLIWSFLIGQYLGVRVRNLFEFLKLDFEKMDWVMQRLKILFS